MHKDASFFSANTSISGFSDDILQLRKTCIFSFVAVNEING